MSDFQAKNYQKIITPYLKEKRLVEKKSKEKLCLFIYNVLGIRKYMKSAIR